MHFTNIDYFNPETEKQQKAYKIPGKDHIQLA